MEYEFVWGIQILIIRPFGLSHLVVYSKYNFTDFEAKNYDKNVEV